ncbi:ribonuclease H-like domain-containing protein [Tanacetum coccineum]
MLVLIANSNRYKGGFSLDTARVCLVTTKLSENGTTTQVEETSLSEGNVSKNSFGSLFVPTHNLTFNHVDSVQSEPKRFSRIPKLPTKLNDYVVDSKVKYGLEKHVSYTKLNSVNFCFTTTLDKSVEPSNYYEAASDPKWIEAMNEEIDALYRNFTWAIIDLPKGRKAIGCKWLYKIKYKASREIERYKARLVAKGFSQKEDVYITLPLSFGDDNDNKHGFVQNDIDITRNCKESIDSFKLFLKNKFMIKDLGTLKYFLGIKVLENKSGVCLTQRKYYLELLHEYGLLAAKPAATPLPENVVLNSKENDHDKFLKNITEYQKLVGKLIYLTHTRPGISYSVQCLSQYMHSSLQCHFKVALRVLRYLKGAPGIGLQFYKSNDLVLKDFFDVDWAKCLVTKKSVLGFVVMTGDCLISWKSKKQPTISRSSVEAEYRCLATSTCEIIWICNVLGDMKIIGLFLVKIFCDSSYAFQIESNQVFHEKIKHFEIDVHIVREKVSAGVIKTEKIHTSHQVAGIFIKGLGISQHHNFVGSWVLWICLE